MNLKLEIKLLLITKPLKYGKENIQYCRGLNRDV